MLEQLILGLLLYKDLSIYDMKKALDEGINQFFSTSFGALHPAVSRLSAKGFTQTKETVENGRAKKVYSLTEAGRAHFLKWLETDIAIRKVNEEGLLRVFFYKELPLAKQIELLSRYIRELQERRAALEAVKAVHRAAAAEIPMQHREAFNYRVTTIDFGLGYYEFAAGWYERLRNDIEAGRMSQ